MATKKQLIARGKKLLREENFRTRAWTWGDLALEVAPYGQAAGGHAVVMPAIVEFAESINWTADRSISTLLHYRRTAEAFPPETRNAILGFSIHSALARHPDRHVLIQNENLTVAQAQEFVRTWIEGVEVVPPLNAHRPYRISLDRLTTAMRDPETVRAVLADADVLAIILQLVLSDQMSPDRSSEPPRRNLFARLVAA